MPCREQPTSPNAGPAEGPTFYGASSIRGSNFIYIMAHEMRVPLVPHPPSPGSAGSERYAQRRNEMLPE